jgi:class 3 adenylate cyclase
MPALQSDFSTPIRAPLVILFVETRGFTRISEMLEPAVVIARLSEFFALVTESVEQYQGIVIDVVNDNLIAAFDGERDAVRAVQTAQDIQRKFMEVEESWHNEYGIRAATSMGIHSGSAVIGLAPDGKSAGQRHIVGDAVSVAERLLHRARAGEFVMSKVVFDALAASQFELDAEALPALEVPRRTPIALFGVPLDTRLDFT